MSLLLLPFVLLGGAAEAAPVEGAADAATIGQRSPEAVAREHLPLPSQRVELTPEAVDWAGGTLVRFRQRLDGLPVHGRSLVVSVGGASKVRRAAGRVVREAPPTSPKLDAAAATLRARGVQARVGLGELWAPRAELVWLDVGERNRLAWSVDFSTASPANTWRTWIDARDGTVLATDLTSRTARANVYAVSPAVSELGEVALPGLLADTTTLEGDYVSAGSCDDWEIALGWFGVTACHSSSSHAVADSNGDFLFAPDPGSIDDPMAEVQVYYHLDLVSVWLDERYGFRHPDPIRTMVNFPMTNAFFGDFDGDGAGDVSFGHDEESGVDFAYDADVVYHEFGHSVVSVMADLPFLRADSYGMDWVAGSINEGYADILSMVLTGDPLTGEYAGSAVDRVAIRELEADRRCPDDLVGEVHVDGMILGALAWNLVEQIGPEVTHDLFFGALPFWGRDVSWPLVGQTLLDSAADLLEAGALDGATHDIVLAEVERANLLDCGRVLPLDGGRETTQFMINAGLQGDLERFPLGLQLSLEVPEDATSARLEILGVEGHEGLGWAVYGRSGEHVAHEVISVDGLGIAVAKPVTYDFVVEGEGVGTVEVNLHSDPPLVPGETMHFAVASRNLGSIALFDFQTGRITLAASTSDEVLPDTGTLGGCGCSSTSTPVAPVGLVVLLALLRRRRRE